MVCNNHAFFTKGCYLKMYLMIACFMFLLRYFKYYRNQNLKKDYFFLMFYFIHNIMFILLQWDDNKAFCNNNIKRCTKIDLLQSVLFLQ